MRSFAVEIGLSFYRQIDGLGVKVLEQCHDWAKHHHP